MKIEVGGEILTLLPEKAIYWEKRETLIFSDVHLGKAESLLREGLAVPAEAGESDLQRLTEIIDRTQAKHALILGDFIHNRKSWSRDLKENLRDFFNLHINIHWQLILGNHERGSELQLEDLPVQLQIDSLNVPPFIFAHGHKSKGDDMIFIEGHVHPVMTLRDGPLRMRCPCFVLSDQRLILPSFGSWTGGHEIEVLPDKRVFAIAGKEVFEVSL